MDKTWVGIIAGIALVIAELATGTFYLLVLAVAAFAGAATAYLQQSFWTAAVIAAAVAAIGVIGVGRYRAPAQVKGGSSLDVGQTVVFESWRSEADRLARVGYRNSMWDARVLDVVPIAPGSVLHIRSVEGNTLIVSVAAD